MSDHFVEPITSNPQELPKIFEGMQNYISPVATKPAKVTKDSESENYIYKADLPFTVGGSVSPDDTSDDNSVLIRILASNLDKDPKAKYLSFKTTSAKRADYLWPVVFKLKDKIGSVMMSLMAKGLGDVRALKAKGTAYTSDYPGGEIRGAASIGDLRVDAKNSKILSDSGVRTRVALGIYQLDEIPIDGVLKTPQQLLEEGIVQKAENLPGIGIFAARGVYRVEDVSIILQDEKIDSPVIQGLIKYILQASEFDESPEFKQLFKKHGGLLQNNNIPIESRKEVIKDYYMSFSSVMGKQAAKLEKIKAVRRKYSRSGELQSLDETVNNIGCMAELMDNSDMHFDATPEEIAKYQKAFLGEVTLHIDDYVGRITGDMNYRRSALTQFFDSYLDEISPGWRETTIPQDFIDRVSNTISFESSDDLRRAYSVCALKLEDALKSDQIDEGYASNLTYPFLNRVLYETNRDLEGKFLRLFLKDKG